MNHSPLPGLRRLPLLLRCASVLLAPLALPARAITPEDLCTGDPCVISRDIVLREDRVELSFGTRAVVLRAALDAKDNSLTIRAGDIRIDPQGQLQGTATILLDSATSVHIGGTSSRGAVRMVDEDGGDLSVVARNGSVTGAGKIVLSSTSAEGDGGGLSISASDAVFLTGPIEAIGGIDGGGGSVDVVAGGNASLTGEINLNGGGFDGGSLDIVSQGSIFLRALTLDGGGDLGNGGDADLVAAGDVTFLERVLSRGSAAGDDQCGDGGTIDVRAGGNFTVAQEIDVSARAGDCWAGNLELSAGAVVLRQSLVLRGSGSRGRGGDLSLQTVTDFACSTAIDFSGAEVGGFAQIESRGDIDIGTGCILDGTGAGSRVELSSGGRLVFDGNLQVGSPSAGAMSPPATVRVVACTMRLGETAIVRNDDADADNIMTVAGHLVVRGSILASRRNWLIVPPDSPPLLEGSVIPAATTIFDPDLLPCGGAAATATATATSSPMAATETPTPSAEPTATIAPTSPPSTLAPTATPSGTGLATATPMQPATATASASPTPTATEPRDRSCFGDCDGDGRVAVSELVRLTNIALGRVAECGFLEEGETVGIPSLIRAVRASLDGC